MNKKKTNEKIFIEALACYEEGLSVREIVALFPEHENDVREFLEVAQVFDEYSKSISVPKSNFALLHNQLVTNKSATRFIPVDVSVFAQWTRQFAMPIAVAAVLVLALVSGIGVREYTRYAFVDDVVDEVLATAETNGTYGDSDDLIVFADENDQLLDGLLVE